MTNSTDALAASGPTAPTPRLAGHVLADGLAAQGVDTIFGVPGESYLAVLDGLYRHRERIRFVICRQEGGAAFMADAYGKLTGRPGVLMVTRGPGATNASIGIHTAHQDSTPMVVLVGQVGNDFIDREAFQEIDYRRMFGPLTKWVAQIDRPERIPEYLSHAFQVATSGRMGPVLLALPEDMLVQTVSVADAPMHQPVQAAPSPEQRDALARMLAAARRPIVLLGGSGWSPRACDDLRAFAHANALPVTCAFRWQDLFDNDDPHYAGDVGIGINPRLAERIRGSDLVLAIGPRLGEITTSGYSLFDVPVPRQPMVHVHPGVEELGRVYRPTMMINAGMPQFTAMLRDLRVDASAWRDTVAQARVEYEAWQQRPPAIATTDPALDLWSIVQVLRRRLPHDTIVTNGAGNFATWAHRFWRYGGLRSQLAPTSGAMGAGLPAAVAAKLAAPGRTVLCLAGDGEFLMTGQELATAAQYGAGVVVLVFNNGMYGTIRMHQEREYPARVFGSALTNPDFARLAEAFGGFGTVVSRTDAFEPALDAALAFAGQRNLPAVIELRVDPQLITPNLTLDQIRAASAARAG
jgi:acetolactate synthase-1/2/3 large subunit